MTGRHHQGPRARGRGPRAGRRLAVQSRLLQQLPYLAGGLHLPDAPGHAVAPGEHPASPVHPAAGSGPTCSRSSTRRPTRWPGSSWKSTPTTSNSRRRPGCVPPRPSGWKPSVPTTRKAGSRSTGSSTPSASMPRPWRPEAQYKTTYNISIVALEEAEGHAPGLQQHRGGRGSASRGRRTSRPATSRTPTASCRSLPTGRCTVRRSPGPSIPIPFRPTRRRTSSPATSPPCRPRSARSDRRPRPLPPYRPAGEPPILSQKPAQSVPGDPEQAVAARPSGRPARPSPAGGTVAPPANQPRRRPTSARESGPAGTGRNRDPAVRRRGSSGNEAATACG